MKLERGDTVDRYTVEKPLGLGGTAVVYRVRHNQLGTRHALKLLTITGESIRRRLLQEGRAQAMLGHLNIVAVTDIVDIDGQPGLLMEYIDGPSLEDALHEYRMTLDDAETLFLGVLSGVRAAHALGLIHRDLKPANVLLSPTADGFVPKVTDFGLAKAIRGEPLREGATRQGVAMGTPSYMAPEQIRDAGKVDERADMFSLGCILYELVTRARAFPGEDVLEIYNNVSRGRYVPARRLVPELPERFDQAIRGCLAVDRDRRIPDCDTLLAVLRGDRPWELASDPDTLPEPPPIPSLGSQVPPITLAPRAHGGGTPGPSPYRVARPISDSEVSETEEITRVGIGATTTSNEPAGSRWIAALLVTGSLLALGVALLFAAVGVGVPVLLLDQGPAEVPEMPSPAPSPAPDPPAPTVEPRSRPTDAGPAPTAEPVASPEPAATPSIAPPARPAPVTPAPAPQPAPIAPAPSPIAPESVATALPVKIFSDPPTAAIRVDGRQSGRATNAKLELAPGPHRIEVTSGERTLAFDIRVGPGQPERWCAVFATGTVIAGDCPRGL